MIRFRLLVTLLLVSSSIAAQDTLNELSFETFMEMVTIHHPIAKQADLKIDNAEAKLQKARGAFDPYAFAGLSEKFFDGKSYYKLANGGLKIPTWYGIELKAGYEQNTGVFLNPEQNVPQGGLAYGGITANIGNGLFIDQRRASLQQAKIGQSLGLAERRVLYNSLLYEAGSAYWDWFKAFNTLKVYEDGLILVVERFKATKRTAFLGDRPSIDTLEASIQVQNRLLNVQQARLDYQNATAKLGVYLWVDGIVPLELTQNAAPPVVDSVEALAASATFIAQLDSISDKHPLLQQYRFKIEGLDIEKKLKKEQLKPDLNFTYTPLSEPINNNPVSGLSLNNYKWGVQFNMPIFLRKERGDLAITDIKLQQNMLELKNKNAEISYKAIASINTWNTTNTQALLYQNTVKDYNGLLKGEQQKFNLGESSVFLVNRREIGYITAQIKYIELLAKNHKSALGAEFAMGLLYP